MEHDIYDGPHRPGGGELPGEEAVLTQTGDSSSAGVRGRGYSVQHVGDGVTEIAGHVPAIATATAWREQYTLAGGPHGAEEVFWDNVYAISETTRLPANMIIAIGTLGAALVAKRMLF